MTSILLLVSVLALSSTAFTATTHKRDVIPEPIAPVNGSDGDIESRIDNVDAMEMSTMITCLTKIIYRMTVTCDDQVHPKWNTSMKDTWSEQESRAPCCALWEIRDCELKGAKIYCTPYEERIFYKQMQIITAESNVNDCPAFRYGQNNCSLGPQNVVPVHSEPDGDVTREQGAVASSEQVDLFGDVNRAIDKHKSVLGEESGAISERSIDVHNNATKDTQAIARLVSLLNNSSLLTKELMERVERITVTKMVIDFHPGNEGPTGQRQRNEKLFKP